MKKILFSLIMLVFGINLIFAWSPFEIYGGQRVGTSSATFLKIGVGSRGVALGGAFSALVSDASALYWNPAAITSLTYNNEVFLNHITYVADINYDFAGITQKIGNNYFGFSFGLLGTNDMAIRDEYHPEGTGEFFKYKDAVLGLTYATKMTNRFSFGITFKYVEENADIELGRTVLIDLGTLYNTEYKGIKIAAVISNFGKDLKPSGTYHDPATDEDTEFKQFAPPTIFKLGVSYVPIEGDISTLRTSAELVHAVDSEEKLALGVEYELWKVFDIRVGYRANEDTQNFTIGIGGKMELFGKRIKLDYAAQNYMDFGFVHQFSLTLNMF